MANSAPLVVEEVPLPTLHVMSYNCLGLKYISHHRQARLLEIGRQISLLDPLPHIVGLQECWVYKDFEGIRKQTASILPYGKFYFSGCFGGGLAILSKYPIEESFMHRYPLNGRPTAFFRGDWYVGKGVACTQIRLPSAFSTFPTADMSTSDLISEKQSVSPTLSSAGPIVSVFNTHLHAPYGAEEHVNGYLSHRTAQAWELSKLLRNALERGHLVLALGDINSLPLSLPHRIITARGGVHDTWRVLHPDSSLGASHHAAEKERGKPVPTAIYNVTENGTTSDSVWNTWRWPSSLQSKQYRAKSTSELRVIPDSTPDPKGKRLDYIFYGHEPHHSGPSLHQTSSQTQYQPRSTTDKSEPQLPPEQNEDKHHYTNQVQTYRRWHVTSAHVGMHTPDTYHPTLHCSLSDHFSIHCTFHLLPLSPSTSSPSSPSPPSPPPSIPPLTASEIQTIQHTLLPSLHAHISRSQHQRLLTSIFAIFIIFPACSVGIWFVPHAGIAFCLLVVSTLAVVAAAVDGVLIGGLWNMTERSVVREWEWEVENLRGRMERDGERGEKGRIDGEGNGEGGQEGDGKVENE